MFTKRYSVIKIVWNNDVERVIGKIVMHNENKLVYLYWLIIVYYNRIQYVYTINTMLVVFFTIESPLEHAYQKRHFIGVSLRCASICRALDALILVSSLCGSILINLIRAKVCCNGNPLVLWGKASHWHSYKMIVQKYHSNFHKETKYPSKPKSS